MSFSGRIERGPMAADVLGRDFTMVHNAALRDRRLSRRARGLLVEVLSHRAGFAISEASLVAAGPEGRDAIRKALRELEAYGYLHREQGRAGGRFGETVFRLTDMPEGLTVRAGSPWTDSQSTGESPRSGPLTEKPTTEKPTTENPLHKKTKFQKTNLSPAADVPASPSAGPEVVTDERENAAGREDTPTPAAGAAADIPPESATEALCVAWASGAGIPRTPSTIGRQIDAQALSLAAAYPDPEQQRAIAEFAGRHRWQDLERAAMHPDCIRLLQAATRPATAQPADRRATAIADCNACDQYGWLLTDADDAARKCRHLADPPVQQAA